jgi:hypothetical protein
MNGITIQLLDPKFTHLEIFGKGFNQNQAMDQKI